MFERRVETAGSRFKVFLNWLPDRNSAAQLLRYHLDVKTRVTVGNGVLKCRGNDELLSMSVRIGGTTVIVSSKL